MSFFEVFADFGFLKKPVAQGHVFIEVLHDKGLCNAIERSCDG